MNLSGLLWHANDKIALRESGETYVGDVLQSLVMQIKLKPVHSNSGRVYMDAWVH